MNEIILKLKWENGVSFEMMEKVGEGDTLSVIKIEENADIASIWTNISRICGTVWAKHMRNIGSDMQKP